ncbi:sigma-70 family RNA polymerase sigma factor [Candidatus Poribacteria bacterium]
MAHDNVDLVQRAIQGERDAFEELVRKYQDAIYGLAFHITGNFADAQDITQQTFVTAYLKLSKLRSPARFIQWLKRIVINESVSWMRKQQRISRLQERMDYSHNPVPTPHQEYEEKEINAAVRKAMGLLSEKNRLAITMYYIDGLTQREVGSFLGIPTSTVGNRISRGKKQLREEMIKMVEGIFRSNRLPDGFAEKVKESLEEAQASRREGDLGAALTYSNEVLDALASVPEGAEARRLRKEALWLKGEAARFPLHFSEALKYHEQALELAKEEDDREAYGLALTGLAYDYTLVDQDRKAAEYRQKALEIFEEIDNLAAQAEIWMARGDSVLFSDSPKAMEYYQRSLDLCNQAGEEDYGSRCRAALALLKELGDSPGTDKLIMCVTAADVIEKVSDNLVLIRECGFFHNQIRPDDWRERVFRASLFYELKAGDNILDYNSRVGDERRVEDFTYVAPFKATRTVESDSEAVKVMAGAYENCLKVRTILTSDPGDDNTKRYRELTQGKCGTERVEQTKQAWFAPGVGPVKFIFDAANGVHLHMELAEYSVKNGASSYFPLAVGNRWIYHWCDVDERYVAQASYEVAVKKDDGFYEDQKGDRFYIDHYAYAYFSGSAKEYEELREEFGNRSSLASQR